jgi:SPP1 gp7 family putative phage head morphogenesis protein
MNTQSQLYKSSQIRHKTLLEGQKERIVIEIVKFLTESVEDMVSNLSTNMSDSKRTRYIANYTSDMFKEARNIMTGNLQELAKYESAFQVQMIKAFNQGYIPDTRKIGGISDSLIKRLIKESAFEGDIIENFLEDQRISLTKNTIRKFNIGVSQGLSTDNIIKSLKANVTNISARNLTILTRTATTNVLNSAKHEVYKRNEIERYQYVAILDKKTTKICQKLDGKVFRMDDPTAPRPPQHYQCRSSTIPIFSDDDIIKETYAEWNARQTDKNIKVKKDGSFEVNQKEIMTLKKLQKEEAKKLKNLKG